MTRFRRVVHPNTLVHVIVRFQDHAYILDSHEARGAYLERVGRYFSRSDWRLLSYGLMSTHVHFGTIAGAVPLRQITQPLHGSFAHWLKRRAGGRRLGHVVASRPTSKELPLSAARNLIAYHHNNPVKAGIVGRAAYSSWTSHRSYINGDAPPWLQVELGLALCALTNSTADRRRFDMVVDGRVGEELADVEEEFAAQRRECRQLLGSSVELGSPRLSSGGALIAEVFAPTGAVVHPRWSGDLQQIVAIVAHWTSLTPGAICSRDRTRAVAQARRLVVLCGHVELHRPIGEVAAVVGISSSAARQLEKAADKGARQTAGQLAAVIRGTCHD